MTSLPASAGGMARTWMGVGCAKRARRKASRASGERPSWAKEELTRRGVSHPGLLAALLPEWFLISVLQPGVLAGGVHGDDPRSCRGIHAGRSSHTPTDGWLCAA